MASASSVIRGPYGDRNSRYSGLGGGTRGFIGSDRIVGVLHDAEIFAACKDFVGRAPWPAADPLVGLPPREKSRTRGSGADEGVRPTVRLRLRCSAGQAVSPADSCFCATSGRRNRLPHPDHSASPKSSYLSEGIPYWEDNKCTCAL